MFLPRSRTVNRRSSQRGPSPDAQDARAGRPGPARSEDRLSAAALARRQEVVDRSLDREVDVDARAAGAAVGQEVVVRRALRLRREALEGHEVEGRSRPLLVLQGGENATCCHGNGLPPSERNSAHDPPGTPTDVRVTARHLIDGREVAVVEREEDDLSLYELVVDGVRLDGDWFPVEPSAEEIAALLRAGDRFPPCPGG